MIDLHCHMLPGLDDGPSSVETSLEMARIALAEGITHTVCTPHAYPGMYPNTTRGITAAIEDFRLRLRDAGIPLKITIGCDAHLVPELLDAVKTNEVPTINGTRYLLVEPSHHVCPPRLQESVFAFVAAGYVPIITHPERLTWVAGHYDTFLAMARQGAWMQITAGALTGKFGRAAKYWGEKFVSDGFAHVIATDAHTTGRRAPRILEALAIVERMLGKTEAAATVLDRPAAVLNDTAPTQVPPPPALAPRPPGSERRGFSLSRLFGVRPR